MQQLKLGVSAKNNLAQKVVKESKILGESLKEEKNIGFSEEITGFRACPECGHGMPPQLVVCWWCGCCLDKHIRELAESQRK